MLTPDNLGLIILHTLDHANFCDQYTLIREKFTKKAGMSSIQSITRVKNGVLHVKTKDGRSFKITIEEN